MESKIKEILAATLPEGTYIHVSKRKNFFGGDYIRIGFAASDIDINRVDGQKPQLVSLSLELDAMELETQVFGGNGGNRIYLIPNKEHPKEKYLAMASVKIPFRKPQKNEKAVLSAIERFAEKWVIALKENRNRLFYQDLINYDTLLAN